MHRRLHIHPRPLMILLAIVLCLIATSAFAQARLGGGSTAPRNTGVTSTAAPSGSGLTSGAAPGLTSGTPAASGITSGSAALPPGTPAASGLTSGTAGAAPGLATTGNDITVTTTGGSTRGVVILPADPNAPAGGSLAANAATTDSNATNAAGASGGAVTGGTPSVATSRAVPIGTFSAVQVAQLFGAADVDGDGLLTRAEALRLGVVTMSFDDMDTNRDGVVSRSEYESSLR